MPFTLAFIGIALALIATGVVAYALGRRHDEDPFGEPFNPEDPRVEPDLGSWFHGFLQALEAGALCIDRYDTVLTVNPAAARLFGSTVERMLGRATIEATGSVELDRRVAEARLGEPSHGNVEVATSRHTVMLDLKVVPLGDGGVLVIAIDLTALHESERIRREFLGNVSHELRTPLAGIKLMFETLEAVDLPETRAQFYPQIHGEIDRLVEIVEHLLEVARAQGGRLQLRLSLMRLEECVTGALATIEPRVSASNVVLVRELDTVGLYGDGARLAQVVTNLVENALRHTPAGGRITVRTFEEDQHAVLEVADTGCGIPFKDLPYIFERFYVVDRSRAKSQGGLGLGLSLVKGTVEAHGGVISVVSEFGVGSCFTARIPIATLEEHAS